MSPDPAIIAKEDRDKLQLVAWSRELSQRRGKSAFMHINEIQMISIA